MQLPGVVTLSLVFCHTTHSSPRCRRENLWGGKEYVTAYFSSSEFVRGASTAEASCVTLYHSCYCWFGSGFHLFKPQTASFLLPLAFNPKQLSLWGGKISCVTCTDVPGNNHNFSIWTQDFYRPCCWLKYTTNVSSQGATPELKRRNRSISQPGHGPGLASKNTLLITQLQ